MSEIIIYHNNQCSKSREALSILKDAGVDFEIIEYLKVEQWTCLQILESKLSYAAKF